MKISIDLDCTPEEARRLLGLPDVTAMNDQLVRAMAEKMTEAAGSFDAEAAARQWAEAALGGMERMQRAFWSQAAGAAEPGAKKKG